MPVKDLKTLDPKSRRAFRTWLKQNHQQKESVWITIYKAHTGPELLRRNDVVEECLCFGWIDGRARKNNEDSFFQLICPRREKSVWSAVNKKKIADLVRRKLITKHGLNKVKIAKKNGSWDALNRSDQLLVPLELRRALARNKVAAERFGKLSKSSLKVVLEWIYSARSEATRANRIRGTVSRLGEDRKVKD